MIVIGDFLLGMEGGLLGLLDQIKTVRSHSFRGKSRLGFGQTWVSMGSQLVPQFPGLVGFCPRPVRGAKA